MDSPSQAKRRVNDESAIRPLLRRTAQRASLIIRWQYASGDVAARTTPCTRTPMLQPRLPTSGEGVRCESMTLKEAFSVPKHTSAMCVQSFDDSLNSAIHTTYRISLRSSSMREPRYPLLKVVYRWFIVCMCVQAPP